ncbi:MAG: lamin tail domain-containing protein [Myxococcales bacterium]|nr:lamin tail domain-containing protein [Myxococcales bacterium]
MIGLARAVAVCAGFALASGCIIEDLAAVGRPCGSGNTCGPGAVCNSTTLICESGQGTDMPPQFDLGDGPRPDTPVDITPGEPPPDVGTESGVPPAICKNTTKLVINEVAVGAADYVVIFNLGGVTVDLQGYTLYYAAGTLTNVVRGAFRFPSSRTIVPGQAVYVFEESKGAGADVNTGAPMPFESKSDSAVALFDPQGNLVDYVAIGSQEIMRPQGATFAPQPVTINLLFEPETESYQRSAYAGRCPDFFRDDWLTKSITRMP